MGHTVGGGILIRVTVRVRVRTALMDTGRARFRGQSEDSALGCKTVGVIIALACCRSRCVTGRSFYNGI